MAKRQIAREREKRKYIWRVVNVRTWNRCRPEQVVLYARDATAFWRVGVVSVVDLPDKFCIDCFNGELRINSSKSSSISSILWVCGVIDDEPFRFCEWSTFWAMRKLISKSNGLFVGWVFVLKDSDRANVLLNCGQTPGDCGLFGMRTSLLCRFVSMFALFGNALQQIHFGGRRTVSLEFFDFGLFGLFAFVSISIVWIFRLYHRLWLFFFHFFLFIYTNHTV